MTSRNDENNWLVVAIGQGGENDYIVANNQVENIARKEAEDYANANPGVPVCVYQRIGTVKTIPTVKWE